MKKFIAILSVFAAISCNASNNQWNQAEYDRILSSIKEPVFEGDTVDIVSRGAKPDDPNFRNDCIINEVIDELCSNGGGVLKIPAGVFYTAGIKLLDNVNLYLSEGAVLRFSTDPKDYLPVVWTRWEGYDCYNYRALIYGENLKNAAITGSGIIDGCANKENWWWMKGVEKYGYKEGQPSQKTHGRKILFENVSNGVDYHKRIFGEGYYLRPQLLNIMKGENILIEGVTFKNSPFWVIHPVMCTSLIVRGVTVDSHGPNNDGCDPESCKGVLIENCHFITGDDCIALKSGRNEDGRKWAIPCEDVIVRHCLMEDGHGAITVGSEISGGARNIYAHNCIIDSPNMYNTVRIKTNTCRGGVIEDIHVKNLNILKCDKSAIIVDLQYEPKEESNRGFYPMVRNVSVEDINIKSCNTFVTIDGLEERTCVENVRVSNCSVSGIKVREKVNGKVSNYKAENINYE